MGEFYLFYNFGHFSKVFPLKKFFVVVDVNLTFALKPGALFPISIFCPKLKFVFDFLNPNWTKIQFYDTFWRTSSNFDGKFWNVQIEFFGQKLDF